MTEVETIVEVMGSINVCRESLMDVTGEAHFTPTVRGMDRVDLSLKVKQGQADEVANAFYDGRLRLVILEDGE